MNGQTSAFKYKWMDTKFVCITVYDERLNVIYMQTNNGYTAKYDCNKEEWIILIHEELERAITHKQCEMGKLILNENILTWYLNNGKIKELNLSDIAEVRKWIDSDIVVEARLTEEGDNYKFRLF